MYREFFRLQYYPFRHTTQPAVFYEGSQQREILARLTYGLQEGRDLMLLAGKMGSGKSLLARVFTARLGQEWQVIKPDHPWMSGQEFLRIVRNKLVMIPEQEPSRAYDEPLEMIARAVLHLEQQGRRVLLLIDDAELYAQEALQAVCFLANLEAEGRRLLPILLVAREEAGLETRLDTPLLRPLLQRVSMHCVLDYLSEDETDAYILQHLRDAGGDPSLFPRDCVNLIYQFSQGCPRLINQACDDVLLRAFSERQTRITLAIVRRAMSEPPYKHSAAVTREPVPPAQTPAQPSPPPSVEPASAPRKPARFPFQVPTPPASEAKAGKRWFNLVNVVAFCFGAGLVMLWSVVQGGYLHRLSPTQRSMVAEPAHHSVRGVTDWAAASAATLTTPVGRPLPMPSAQFTRRVHIDPRTPLIYWTSEFFGAWNATVRDLLATYNPGLDPMWPPSGDDLLMPVLTRADLVVTDDQGQTFVYVATFDELTEAQAEADSLNAFEGTNTKAVLVPARLRDTMVWRLYAGPFVGHRAAQSAAERLEFTQLPVLNIISKG